jgi:hypothetical protein
VNCVKILYIVGFGRSGSTIFDVVLGELRGFFSAGELQSLWQGALVEGRLCGCGVPVAQCPLWTEVLWSEKGTLGASPDHIVALQQQTLGAPMFGPRRVGPGRSQRHWRAYGAILRRLYARIAEVTGAKVIVDSSKVPSVALLLEALPNIEAYFVHLVRDPRGVAYSWARKKAATDRPAGGQLERFGIVKSSSTWVLRHTAAEAVRRRSERPWALVRYEDFIASPSQTVAEVNQLLNGMAADINFLSEGEAMIGINHTVSGNPVRLQRGRILLREDEEWKVQLKPSTRTMVTALTWPLLMRYGYVSMRPRDEENSSVAANLPDE